MIKFNNKIKKKTHSHTHNQRKTNPLIEKTKFLLLP